MNTTRAYHILRLATLTGCLGWTLFSFGQQAGSPARSSSADNSLNEPIDELRQQVRELQTAVAEIRAESQRYRAETAELRRQLEAVRTGAKTEEIVAADAAHGANAASYSESGGAAAGGAEDQKKAEHAAKVEEEYELLSGKIDDQYQSKVESASKYKVRLSGIVLLNLFSNHGTVDSIDVPSVAYDTPPGVPRGSLGATLRQSQIGFEVFGPELGGARTKADLQLDLAGGFPQAPNGVNAGLLRLRTGTVHLDWAKTSVVAGQDGLFFSPESPTSFASLSIPALAYAGNLWGWIPQVRVEHKWAVGEESSLLVQGGIVDPLSGEAPVFNFYRAPQGGERSRQPAYATRLAWVHTIFGQPLRIGVAGYYSRQNYGFGHNVDAWAGMSDLELPLSRQVTLSGKVYRGSGLGGIGGGMGRSALFSDVPGSPTAMVRALNSVGGWAQLKYRPAAKLELNGAFGQENPFAADVRAFPAAQAFGDPTLIRNQGSFANIVYRPRSDLLFSAEYRHLRTFNVFDQSSTAEQLNLTMGVLF